MTLGDPVLLVPRGDPATPEALARLESSLRERGVTPRRAAAEDAERVVADGAKFLVHCGGQASLVRWLPLAVNTDLVVGIFPGGARNDFARTFGLDTNGTAASILLTGPRVLRVDVGVARTTGGETYVFNHAVAGLGAEAVRRMGRGRVRNLLAWYRALARHRTTTFDVDMTFAEYHGEATQVRIANGIYAFGGLRVAPMALPDDGAWDVQVWAGPRTLPFSMQPLMLRGEHLPNEHVSQWRQKRAEVVATPPVRVAVDDVVVGTTPATFELLPKALRLKI